MTYAGGAYAAEPYAGAQRPTAAATPAATGYAAAVLADAPLAYYRLGGSGTTLVDSSGNSHHGTYSMTPTHAAGLLAGDTDTALDTAATPNVAGVVTSAPWMDVQTLTVEALVRPTSVTGYHFVTSREQGGVGNGGTYWLALRDGRVSVLTHPGGNSTSNFQSNATIAVGTTYHLALVVTPTSMSLYVNGALDQSVAVTAALPSTTRDLYIGLWENGGLPFTGLVDEVAYYGTALSATRLAAHYAQVTNPTAGPPTGALAVTLPRFGAAVAGTSALPARTGTLAATLPRFTATAAGTSTPPARTGTLAATLPHFTAAVAGTYTTGRAGVLQVTLPRFSATLAGTRALPATSAALTVTLPPFTAQVGATVPDTAPPLAPFTASLQGQVAVIIATDTSYRNDGYAYTGSAALDYSPPVAAAPPGVVRRDVRRVHQSLPTPTLVRGRPQ